MTELGAKDIGEIKGQLYNWLKIDNIETNLDSLLESVFNSNIPAVTSFLVSLDRSYLNSVREYIKQHICIRTSRCAYNYLDTNTRWFWVNGVNDSMHPSAIYFEHALGLENAKHHLEMHGKLDPSFLYTGMYTTLLSMSETEIEQAWDTYVQEPVTALAVLLSWNSMLSVRDLPSDKAEFCRNFIDKKLTVYNELAKNLNEIINLGYNTVEAFDILQRTASVANIEEVALPDCGIISSL